MAARDLAKLRRLCMGFPEATEQLTWEDHPTFRVRNKIFVISAADGLSMTLKATREEQAVLVADNPRIKPAPYLARGGWINMDLSKGVDWSEVEELVRDSYRLVAPKKLAALLESEL